MNPKTTIGLVIALILAVFGVWWAQSSSLSEQDKSTEATRLLFDPPLGEVQVFELVVTSSGQALRFEQEEATADVGTAKQWKMTSPITGPAEQHLVLSDVDRIKRQEYVKAYGPNDPDRPGDEMTSLKNPLRIVKLKDVEGKTHVLRIGATQRLSSHTYVQKEGDETIYLAKADLNAELKNGLSDYRGKRVMVFPQAEAVRIEAEGEPRYTLVKSGTRWLVEQPQKARADSGKVSSLLSTLANVNAEKFVDENPATLRPYGLDQPRCAITITTETRVPREMPATTQTQPTEPEFDVRTSNFRLLIGATVEESTFAKLADPASTAVFQIPLATTRQLMQSIDELRDRKIADIGAARAQKVMLRSAAGEVQLTSENNTWRITAGLPAEDAPAAEFAAVDDVIKAVRNMTAVGFESAELPTYGFANPRAVVEMEFEGTVEPARLIFGSQTPSGTGLYVRNDRENFVAVVKADSADAFTVSAASFLPREMLRLDSSQISRLELTFPEWSCAVAKEDGVWRFVEPVQGTAESQAVSNIVQDVSMLRGRKVVALAADAAKYGLDKPILNLSVTVQSPPPAPAEGEESQMPPPPVVHRLKVTRQGEHVLAMLEGGKTICEIDPKVLDDLKAELLDRRVTTLDPSSARRLQLTGPSAMTFQREGDTWRLAGEPTFAVDAAKVTRVFESLRDLRADRYVRYRGADLKEYGLDAPAISVTAETEDGTMTTLMISARGPKDGERFAAVASQAGRVFVIGEDDLANFSLTVADFQRPG